MSSDSAAQGGAGSGGIRPEEDVLDFDGSVSLQPGLGSDLLEYEEQGAAVESAAGVEPAMAEPPTAEPAAVADPAAAEQAVVAESVAVEPAVVVAPVAGTPAAVAEAVVSEPAAEAASVAVEPAETVETASAEAAVPTGAKADVSAAEGSVAVTPAASLVDAEQAGATAKAASGEPVPAAPGVQATTAAHDEEYALSDNDPDLLDSQEPECSSADSRAQLRKMRTGLQDTKALGAAISFMQGGGMTPKLDEVLTLRAKKQKAMGYLAAAWEAAGMIMVHDMPVALSGMTAKEMLQGKIPVAMLDWTRYNGCFSYGSYFTKPMAAAVFGPAWQGAAAWLIPTMDENPRDKAVTGFSMISSLAVAKPGVAAHLAVSHEQVAETAPGRALSEVEREQQLKGTGSLFRDLKGTKGSSQPSDVQARAGSVFVDLMDVEGSSRLPGVIKKAGQWIMEAKQNPGQQLAAWLGESNLALALQLWVEPDVRVTACTSSRPRGVPLDIGDALRPVQQHAVLFIPPEGSRDLQILIAGLLKWQRELQQAHLTVLGSTVAVEEGVFGTLMVKLLTMARSSMIPQSQDRHWLFYASLVARYAVAAKAYRAWHAKVPEEARIAHPVQEGDYGKYRIAYKVNSSSLSEGLNAVASRLQAITDSWAQAVETCKKTAVSSHGVWFSRETQQPLVCSAVLLSQYRHAGRKSTTQGAGSAGGEGASGSAAASTSSTPRKSKGSDLAAAPAPKRLKAGRESVPKGTAALEKDDRMTAAAAVGISDLSGGDATPAIAAEGGTPPPAAVAAAVAGGQPPPPPPGAYGAPLAAAEQGPAVVPDPPGSQVYWQFMHALHANNGRCTNQMRRSAGPATMAMVAALYEYNKKRFEAVPADEGKAAVWVGVFTPGLNKTELGRRVVNTCVSRTAAHMRADLQGASTAPLPNSMGRVITETARAVIKVVQHRPQGEVMQLFEEVVTTPGMLDSIQQLNPQQRQRLDSWLYIAADVVIGQPQAIRGEVEIWMQQGRSVRLTAMMIAVNSMPIGAQLAVRHALPAARTLYEAVMRNSAQQPPAVRRNMQVVCEDYMSGEPQAAPPPPLPPYAGAAMQW